MVSYAPDGENWPGGSFGSAPGPTRGAGAVLASHEEMAASGRNAAEARAGGERLPRGSLDTGRGSPTWFNGKTERPCFQGFLHSGGQEEASHRPIATTRLIPQGQPRNTRLRRGSQT
jgi:hypothetical protein